MKRFLLITFLLPAFLLQACDSAVAPGPEQNTSLSSNQRSVQESSSSFDDQITVDVPKVDALVHTPINVSGRAKGTWFFEATFPVRLLDATGKEIATSHADAQGDWMTDQFVPFTAQLHFNATTATGTLVLSKDNESGLPQNDASLLVPVHFR